MCVHVVCVNVVYMCTCMCHVGYLLLYCSLPHVLRISHSIWRAPFQQHQLVNKTLRSVSLFRSPQCWGYRCSPPHLTLYGFWGPMLRSLGLQIKGFAHQTIYLTSSSRPLLFDFQSSLTHIFNQRILLKCLLCTGPFSLFTKSIIMLVIEDI